MPLVVYSKCGSTVCDITVVSALRITYTGALAFSGAHFGVGTGPIHMDNVACSGSESRLIYCSRGSTVTCTNGHSQDAGVRCQG